MTAHSQSRLSGAVSVMVAQAAVLVFGYATHLWIGRALGPALYGVYGIVLSLQTIFGLFLTLGVPVAVSRYVAQDDIHARAVLKQGTRLQLLIGGTVATVMAAASPLLARALGDPSLTPLIIFSAIIILSQAFYPLYVQYFSGLHLFNRQALLTIVYAAIKLAGALSLIYFLGVYGAFSGFLIGGVVAGAIGWWWTRGVGGTKPQRLPTAAFLQFAGVYVLVLVGLQLLISLDLFMVKALGHDDIEAGYYNAAVTLSRISYMLLQSLGFILLPSVARLTKPGASHDTAALFISDTLRYLIGLIVPSVALAAATSRPLIELFFSRQYLPAAPVLSILMIGLGALAFYLLLTSIVAGADKPTISLGITIGLLIVSALLGFILIPRFGLIGAAWQTTITGLLGLSILGTYTFHRFSIPVPVTSTINICLAAAIAVAPTYLWQATPLTLIPQYVMVGLLYLGGLWLLGEIRPIDRARIAGINPRLRWIAPHIV